MKLMKYVWIYTLIYDAQGTRISRDKMLFKLEENEDEFATIKMFMDKIIRPQHPEDRVKLEVKYDSNKEDKYTAIFRIYSSREVLDE